MKVGHFEDGSKFSLFETQLSKVKSPKRGCRFKSWVGNVYSTCHIPTRIHLQCLLLIHYSNFSYYCPNSKVWKCLQMLSLESKIRPSFASFQISCRGRKKEGVNSLGEDSFGLLKKRLYPPFPLLICDCISFTRLSTLWSKHIFLVFFSQHSTSSSTQTGSVYSEMSTQCCPCVSS